jgi:hypothetical protein
VQRGVRQVWRLFDKLDFDRSIGVSVLATVMAITLVEGDFETELQMIINAMYKAYAQFQADQVKH